LWAARRFHPDAGNQIIPQIPYRGNVCMHNREPANAILYIFHFRLSCMPEELQLLLRFAATRISYLANIPEWAYYNHS
jgi:hypothetical protein